MKKSVLLISSFLFLFSLITSADYVGVKKCRMCHKGEKRGKVFEKWAAREHANAFETLKKAGKEKDPACLKCHVTGFNNGGYKIGDENASKFEGVQCEACHGPGSTYKKMSVMKDKNKALAAGLFYPKEKDCKVCHDDTKCKAAKKFNYKEYLKKIDHNYR